MNISFNQSFFKVFFSLFSLNMLRRSLLLCLVLAALMGGMCAQVESVFLPIEFVKKPELLIFIGVCIIAPIVEEFLKPIGLFILLSEKRDLSLFNWVLLGTFAGLGFKLLEDSVYGLQAIAESYSFALNLLLVRNLSPIHLITTSIAGFGIGLWNKLDKRKYFLWAICTSILIHALFNLFALSCGV
jgi:RsiW-degrading membrane proteinase PrsW (M82 family)